MGRNRPWPKTFLVVFGVGLGLGGFDAALGVPEGLAGVYRDDVSGSLTGFAFGEAEYCLALFFGEAKRFCVLNARVEVFNVEYRTE